MNFIPLNLPLQTPEEVRNMVNGSVLPFVLDSHAMLQLPAEGTLPHVGCNLSIAQVLLSLIGGVSAVLYSTEGGSGRVFREFLTNFYPWDAEPKEAGSLGGSEAARVLYDEYRNPLAHAAGTPVFSVPNQSRRELVPQAYRLQIDRICFDSRPDRGLPTVRLLELESEPVRPGWLPPTLRSEPAKRTLTVESLYWGVRESIRRLCSDSERMNAAAKFLSGKGS